MADVATLVFDIDSTKARTAATDLAKVQQAATGLAGAWSKTDGAMRKSNGQWESSAKVVEKYGNEIANLAREFNPALNAVYEFQKAEERLNRAVALGVVSVDQKTVALERVRVGLAASAAAQLKFGSATQVATHHATSLGYQLNDIGMMMSMGQNPFALMMQQGPQVAQIFSDMNRDGRKIGPTLISAFTGMFNPTTAITLALIGGSAALAQWGMSALGSSADAKSFEDAVSDAESAISQLNDTTKSLANSGLSDLQEKYGKINEEIKSLVETQRLLQIAESAKAVNEAISSISDSLGKGLFNTAYGEIGDVFNVGANEAQILYGVLKNIGEDKSLDKQLLTITTMRQRLSEATNGFTKMSDEQANMLSSLTKAEDLIRQLQNSLAKTPGYLNAATAATESWKSAMSGVLSYINAVSASLISISGSQIKLAAIRTETELLKKGKTLREASAAATLQTAEMEGTKRTKQLELQYGFMGKILGIAEKNQAVSVATAQSELDIARDVARERESKSSGGGAGKAAAELKSAEKGFQSLQELLQKESMFQVAEWEKRQAQLDQALAKKLLSEQQYETMKQQLQMVYFGYEAEQKQVQYQMDQDALQTALDNKLLTEQQYLMKRSELQHQYYSDAIGIDQNGTSQQLSQMAADFGQMNALAGGGYDGLLKAQKAFAAGSALINAYLAASQAMADPTVPYWMKIAAYAKVLAAGFGAVNAIKGASKGGAGGTSSAASSATQSAAKAGPTKNILVNLTGPDFMVDMAESIIQQIYDQSKDGRVVISRG